MAVDIGQRRIGVALSDIGGAIAQPAVVIEQRGWHHMLAQIRRLVNENEVERVVVGLPLRMDGSEGEAAARARAFAARLQAALAVPVELQDERLSTAEAERTMIAGDARRAERRQHRDAVAAALFLQTYLDRRR